MSHWWFRFLCSFTLLVVFFALWFNPVSGNLQDSAVYLSPPGQRLVKDPFIVIPANHFYLNQPLEKPFYRNASKNPAKGWDEKYISTRRFSSDQSAWIYYRVSNLVDSKVAESSRDSISLRIWPVGTTLVLESYQGDADRRNKRDLIEILVMHKIADRQRDSAEAFYSASWCYARFTPQEDFSIHARKVEECHQCHSIAFHLTGDLIFTQFP